MRVVGYLVTITVIGMTFGFKDGLALAAAMPQAEPSLEIEITTAQTQATVGAPVIWLVTLTPHREQGINSVELQSGDQQVWEWVGDFPTIVVLTNTVVLEVSAVPLVSGDLTPVLKAHYNVGKERKSQLATGDIPVHVASVEACLTANIVVPQRTVRKGEHLPVELWIRNNSPFTLAQVQVQGAGTDLAWEEPTGPVEIQAGQIYPQSLYAMVDGEYPQPQLVVHYAWTDATGKSHLQSLSVSGEALTLAEVSVKEPWHTILGVLTGSLIVLIPAWIQDERSRKRQKKLNRQHVHGLLQLMTLQSKHAANSDIEIDLTPLETVFEDEGLFAIVEEDGLVQNMRDLWEKAERHNTRLDRPGGAQRSKELREVAEKLQDRLDSLSTAKRAMRSRHDSSGISGSQAG
jgi:hypothetical protein